MVDRLGFKGKPPLAGEQRSGGVRSCPRLAERRTSCRTRAAAAAARDEHQNDMVASLEVGHPVADRLDDSRGLVAERHGGGARARAVDHREVRMAEARRHHLHLDFAAARRGEIKLSDFERLRVRVGRGKAGLAKNGGLNAHGDQSLGTGNPDAGRDRGAGQLEN